MIILESAILIALLRLRLTVKHYKHIFLKGHGKMLTGTKKRVFVGYKVKHISIALYPMFLDSIIVRCYVLVAKNLRMK